MLSAKDQKKEERELWAKKQWAEARQNWRRFGAFLLLLLVAITCAIFYGIGLAQGEMKATVSRQERLP